jgi:phospholipid/cholesterol/gamma-HCH transport system substrate-binding protein
MSGVRLGEVVAIRFDPQNYKAVVNMRIGLQYRQIPDDSFASIQTEGLLGGKYVGLSPGGSDTYLKDGSRIDQTQSAIVLENIINKLFASYSSKAGNDSQSAPDKQGKSTATQSKTEPKK